MLTREECIKARDIINANVNCDEMSTEEFNKSLVVFNNLINEYFELVDLLKRYDLENLSIEELDGWLGKLLWHVSKVNELSNKLVELDLVVNSKQEMIDELKKTINENIYKIFKNPPLKFDELHEGMWVWDNRTKAYAKIRHLLIREKINAITKEKRNEPRIKFKWGEVVFEENRFYRYEVKDDDYK